MNPRIVLTGTTGKLGGLILKALLRTLPPAAIGLSTRNPSNLSHLSAAGHRVRQGSYDDVAALTSSFSDADFALIISSNDRTGKTLEHHRNAIAACKAAGVKKIYYTSHQAASTRSAFGPARSHAATEDMLAASGLEWVAFRDGFHMDAVNLFMQGAKRGDVIKAPQDGKASWTAHEDISEAAAKIILADLRGHTLSGEGQRVGDKGLVITLAGEEALDMADLAKVYSQISGMEVRRELQSWEDYRAAGIARGAPAQIIDILQGFYEAASNGEFLSQDRTLTYLLETPPITVKDMLERETNGEQ